MYLIIKSEDFDESKLDLIQKTPALLTPSEVERVMIECKPTIVKAASKLSLASLSMRSKKWPKKVMKCYNNLVHLSNRKIVSKSGRQTRRKNVQCKKSGEVIDKPNGTVV